MITPLKKWAVLSIKFGFIMLSSNLFSQETKIYSEEKLQERIKKHQEIISVNQDSLVQKNVPTINDTSKDVNSLEKSDASFPVFIDTGKPEQDQLDYRTRKDKWILENPELYKAMNVGQPMSAEQNEELELKKKQRINNY